MLPRRPMQSSAAALLLAGSVVLALPAAVLAADAASGQVSSAASRQSPDVHRFSIGALDARILRDGGFSFPNDGSVVAIGEARADVDALLAAAGEPADPIRLSLQALLVDAGDRIMLFDTGGGPSPDGSTGGMVAAMAAAGVDPAQVTDIMISHAHGDHVGGLLDGEGALRFPNATVRMSAQEWQALQGAPRRAALVAAITPRVETFERGDVVLPGVTSVGVEGHTPGHSAYGIADGDARLLYIGDTAHHHVVSVRRPRWTIQFDGDAPLAEDSREALLARAADEGLLLQSPHFPFPGLGRVERRDGGFAWVPLRQGE